MNLWLISFMQPYSLIIKVSVHKLESENPIKLWLKFLETWLHEIKLKLIKRIT